MVVVFAVHIVVLTLIQLNGFNFSHILLLLESTG